MTVNKLAAICSSIAVIGAVLAGLYFSGPPGEKRLLRIDERRVEDLARLSRAITAYWEKSSRLPANLSVLVDGQRMRSLPTDPESRAAYTFESIDTRSYRLCAEFSRVSEKSTSEDFWAHQAGLQCFEFGLESDG